MFLQASYTLPSFGDVSTALYTSNIEVLVMYEADWDVWRRLMGYLCDDHLVLSAVKCR